MLQSTPWSVIGIIGDRQILISVIGTKNLIGASLKTRRLGLTGSNTLEHKVLFGSVVHTHTHTHTHTRPPLTPPLLACRKARRPEAALVGGGAYGGGGAPEPEHRWAPRSRQGRLRALPATVPPAGHQPPRLESHQVLLPQSHPAAEEEPAAGKWAHAAHRLLKRVCVCVCVWGGGAGDQSRFSNGTQLPRKLTSSELMVLHFSLFSNFDTWWSVLFWAEQQQQ